MTLAVFFDILFSVGFIRYALPNPALWIVGALICSVIPYLLGSVNFAIIISGNQYNQDIRNYGSGNAGMTNMMRTYGKSAAALTLFGDAMKAVVAGFIGYAALGIFGAHMAGFFCVLGHTFPIFYKFKGGKGVVTAAASLLVCNPYVFVILLVIFVTIVSIWRYISLASIMCVMLYPVILNGMETVLNGFCSVYIIFPIMMAVLIVFKHKENIHRLLNKTESKFSFKKSVKKSDVDKED